MPNVARDSVISLQMFLSLWEGVKFPEGWLCTNMTDEERLSTAYLQTSLLSITDPEIPPFDIITYPLVVRDLSSSRRKTVS